MAVLQLAGNLVELAVVPGWVHLQIVHGTEVTRL